MNVNAYSKLAERLQELQDKACWLETVWVTILNRPSRSTVIIQPTYVDSDLIAQNFMRSVIDALIGAGLQASVDEAVRRAKTTKTVSAVCGHGSIPRPYAVQNQLIVQDSLAAIAHQAMLDCAKELRKKAEQEFYEAFAEMQKAGGAP